MQSKDWSIWRSSVNYVFQRNYVATQRDRDCWSLPGGSIYSLHQYSVYQLSSDCASLFFTQYATTYNSRFMLYSRCQLAIAPVNSSIILIFPLPPPLSYLFFFFFFLMIRRPPSSPLFPNPTLFR